MMVTFVSQCEKKALKKSRHVLDTFANRIGDRTWQTVITEEGLNAVKKLLRKTASKNTAVSCFWLRSRNRSELVWIVGNRQKFNAQGLVPVNSTKKTIQDINQQLDWKYLQLIKCLTALAALFHDWGKASACFQEKLNLQSSNKRKGDPWRHEWISTLLLNTFVNGETDEQWLTRLANGEIDDESLENADLQKKVNPLAKLPKAASLIAWLVVSHHKLPLPKNEDKQNRYKGYPIERESLLSLIEVDFGYENNYSENDHEFQSHLQKCFEFPGGLLSQSKPWIKQMKKWADKMLACLPQLDQAIKDGGWRVILHHARLSLMLGDHHYSSQDPDKDWKCKSEYKLIANTYYQNKIDPKSKKVMIKKGEAKQMLDEHLVGVAGSALKTAHLLPAFEVEPPFALDIKRLKKKSAPPFQWQDKAVEKIKSWKQNLPEKYQNAPFGFFVVNMASTGCGKTFANAKVMRALSKDSESLRYILALGLRTLTLQTGDEYRDRIGLDNTELAVLIGSKAIMELHQRNKSKETEQEENFAETSGSESIETLLDDEEINYECAIPEEGLNTILTNDRDRQFLWAPVLACTIDYMMAATETKRGGRYILPSLRLMSSDLVIDEVDDFHGEDLIAIGRLIHLAGMLGRKVMISSASIPPDLAEGYFNVYCEGWQLFAKTREVISHLGCAWVDEFGTSVKTITKSEKEIKQYQNHHQRFIAKRIKKLIAEIYKKRRAEIIVCDHLKKMEKRTEEEKQTLKQAYFGVIQQAIIEKHQQHHNIDPKTQKKVSFGVVRVANINPCVELTEYLALTQWPEDVEIRVMAYHSQQVLLLRHEQEKHLDTVLKRNNPDTIFEDSHIKQPLFNCKTSNIIFILVATPVEEVGRDHDFDWAVVEPSSFRSFIQLAGRVWRHRKLKDFLEYPNIALMQYNLKGLTSREGLVFCQPGYESEKHPLNTHDLKLLIDEQSVNQSIDAIPRIQHNEDLDPKNSLIDLEHVAISQLLTNYSKEGPDAMQGWLNQCWWLTALPQVFNTFRKSAPQLKLYLVPENERFVLKEKDDYGNLQKVEGKYGIHHYEMEMTALNKMWLHRDYQELLETLAEEENSSLEKVAKKYGEISLAIYGDQKTNMHEYRYSSQLGLSKLQ